jgi:putative FmdB family regulatory protein
VSVPLYEYRCAECEHQFESLVAAGRADQASCPVCGASQVRRLLSVFAAPRGGDGAAAPTGGCCGGACGKC